MKLDTARFKPTDYEVTDFSVTVPFGVEIEDVLTPEYFGNVAPRLTPYSKIRVRTDDGSWYAELLVLSVGRVWAKTFPLIYEKLTTSDVEITESDRSDKYKVMFRGPHLKWCVIHKEDGSALREQMDTKREAINWLSEYSRA